jgi:hypothetical protein
LTLISQIGDFVEIPADLFDARSPDAELKAMPETPEKSHELAKRQTYTAGGSTSCAMVAKWTQSHGFPP